MKYLKLFENKNFNSFYKWLDENYLTFDVRGRKVPRESLWYAASIERGETLEEKGSGILNSDFGKGDTPEEAIQDYIETIKGKILVIDAYDKANRKEYEIPEDFELWADAKKYNL